jgi:gamma-glutamyltranspeptidase / glutathione hydrolase
MRDFFLPGRSPVQGLNGAACTSHPLATLTAIEVLKQGGNAVDAAVAACAVLCVVEPASTGIGGDCFALYKPANGPLVGLNGSGAAPGAARVEWFLERNIREIEDTMPHAATIPGAIDAWATLLRDHGRKSLGELLQPAIRFAEDGFVVHARVSSDWQNAAAKLKRTENATRILLANGEAPAWGSVFKQPKLGATMRRIAEHGRDGFYLGPVAQDIVNYLRSVGGLHSLDDFAAHRSEYVTPIKTLYRGYEVYEIPPNGQGIVALMMLNMLTALGRPPKNPMGLERWHRMAEASKRAYSDRDIYVADMRQSNVPVERLLSREYARGHADAIKRAPAAALAQAMPMRAHADTIYLTVVDRDRNACSFINSLFSSFGTGLVAPESGVVLQNRGSGFVVEPGHLNCIAPGKRPMHTIIPGMLMKDGKAQMPFGVMGGHYQPTGHTTLLTNVLDYGMDVQTALDQPRALAYEGVVAVEPTFPKSVIRGLQKRGHKVEIASKPHGGGQAIWIDWEKGTLTGGSEPRKDGAALAY